MNDPPVSVSPQRYHAASEIFGKNVHAQLTKVINDVTTGLSGSAGMAGDDPGGVAWADAYDQAAKGLGSVLADLDTAALTCADLLEQSGFNHGMAESASDPRQTAPTPPDTTKYATAPPPAPQFPSARGVAGQNGLPPIVLDWLKYVWVNGDSAKLNAASTAWKAAGGSIRTIGSALLPEAVTAISAQQSPEIADATAVLNDFQQQLTSAAGACDDLAGSCTELAGHIETAHNDLVDELQDFVITTVAIEAGGAISALFTFGGGELVAQGLEAARLAKAVERVNAIVQTLVNTVKTVAAAVKNVVTKVAEIAKRLNPFKSSKTLNAEAKAADEQEAALAKGDPAGSGKPQLPWDDPVVKEKLPGEWGTGGPNKKGVGQRWQDPKDPGSGVRIDKGDPSNPQPIQQGDHVVVRDHGKVIGRDGKPLEGSIKDNAAQAHIPLSEWKTWRTWNHKE
jgi:hypothetical protein